MFPLSMICKLDVNVVVICKLSRNYNIPNNYFLIFIIIINSPRSPAEWSLQYIIGYVLFGANNMLPFQPRQVSAAI